MVPSSRFRGFPAGLLGLVAAALLLPACASGGFECGPGTVMVDGFCLGEDSCGLGETLVDGQCVRSCGDGVVDAREVCDDGNNDNGDGCNAACTSEEVCGNGLYDTVEECDDGNTLAGDGCSALCELEACGNGVVDPSEQCDDGNTLAGDGCGPFCRWPAAVSRRPAAEGDVDTSSTSFVPIPGMDALEVRASGGAAILVTLLVPHIVGEPTVDTYGAANIGVTIDGELATSAIWQNAYWGQGGPLSIATVIPSPSAGVHTIEAVWRTLLSGAFARLIAADDVILTATVLNELSSWRATDLYYEHESIGTSQSVPLVREDFRSVAMGALPWVSGLRPVLSVVHIPSMGPDDGETLRMDMAIDGVPFAEAAFEHEGTYHSLSMLAVEMATTDYHTLSAGWVGTGGSVGYGWRFLSAAATQLTVDAPVHATWMNAEYCETSASFTTVSDQDPIDFTLTEKRMVLLAYQVGSAYAEGAGGRGDIALVADGSPVALARVQSQNLGRSTPVVLATVIEAEPGDHHVEVQMRNVSNNVCFHALRNNLTALVLQ